MIKRMIAFIAIFALMLCASSCQDSIRGHIKDAVENKDPAILPTLNLTSTLVCTVEEIIGSQCVAVVTEGNSTYDADTIVLISSSDITDGTPLSVSDVITFTYEYIDDVSSVLRFETSKNVYHNIPHIAVGKIAVIPDYVPVTAPETTAE